MLNQTIIVGRIANEVERKENDGKSVASLTLAVPRNYKNADGVYETDFIDIVLWNAIANSTTEYCKKGDLVGVKGRIRTNINEDKKETIIVAEKVTFLSSKSKSEEE